jgi:hypothetical protein
MADLTILIDRYLDAYGEPDKARRDELIATVFAADGALIDPPLTGEGHQGISGMAEAVQSQFAGHRFRRVSGVDEHHGYVRYAWELVGPDGSVAVGGMDVGELDGDGRLRRVVGFFGDLPQAA